MKFYATYVDFVSFKQNGFDEGAFEGFVQHLIVSSYKDVNCRNVLLKKITLLSDNKDSNYFNGFLLYRYYQ